MQHALKIKYPIQNCQIITHCSHLSPSNLEKLMHHLKQLQNTIRKPAGSILIPISGALLIAPMSNNAFMTKNVTYHCSPMLIPFMLKKHMCFLQEMHAATIPSFVCHQEPSIINATVFGKMNHGKLFLQYHYLYLSLVNFEQHVCFWQSSSVFYSSFTAKC